jgi:hypothetical protein
MTWDAGADGYRAIRNGERSNGAIVPSVGPPS